MTISSSLQYFPLYALSIPSWKKNLSDFFGGKQTINDFLSKKFPQEFLKMGYYLPSKVIWGQTGISNEILEYQGVVTALTSVCYVISYYVIVLE